jgi:hypothetical protein
MEFTTTVRLTVLLLGPPSVHYIWGRILGYLGPLVGRLGLWYSTMRGTPLRVLSSSYNALRLHPRRGQQHGS